MGEVRETDYLHLLTYEAVSKFKSVRRAIRRNHVTPYGVIYPKRPFSNTNTKENRIKKQIYEQLKNSRRAA
nr:MAG TPA: hypothetical protein [Crassvirales sp.]